MPAAGGGQNLRGTADGGNEASEEEEDEEEEEEECGENMAVSGKLAIHLDTGETSREYCLINNRGTALVEDGGSCRSQIVSKEDSTHCFSDEKPLFVNKYKGSGVSSTATPPVPPPRSKSKEGSFSAVPSSSIIGGQERASPRAAAATAALAGNKNDRSPADKSTYYDAQEGPVFVLEATAAASAVGGLAQATKQVHGKPFQGSLDENKNVEFSEKKEVRSDESEVSPSYSCSDRADRGGSAGKTSSSSKHFDPSRSRRKGIVSMPPNELKEYSSTKSTKSDRSAKRISLDDLSSAFQGVGGGQGVGSAGDLKRQGSSSRSRCSQSPASGAHTGAGGGGNSAAAHEYLSDESVPNGGGGGRESSRDGGRYSSSRSTAANSHSTHSGSGGGGVRETYHHHHQQRRSKSEESLLDWVDHVRAG
ncbi:MAG: hypothetical protein GY696_25190 [Gammaproteobacteria bacterium]|nr:hypothetical protein [Gammaproteobacteria bacterium]